MPGREKCLTKTQTKMLAYDAPLKQHESSYFEHIEKDCIRMYGESKGVRLANRYWEIRTLTDPMFQEERIRITYGLA